MKKRGNKGGEHPILLTTEQLCEIWEKIKSDPDARGALNRLNEAGFRISHLTPNDATFKHPSWADYIAALPFLPDKPSTRRIYRSTSVRKYWPLVRRLREFVANANMPFADVAIFSERDYPAPPGPLQENFLKAASTLEHFLSSDYFVRHINPRKALIAELRWAIRDRTGRPHDREISVLIDAVFRAAGHKEGLYIDPTTLDRIEKRAKEGRVKAHRRILRLDSAPLSPLRQSTRNRQNSKKRV